MKRSLKVVGAIVASFVILLSPQTVAAQTQGAPGQGIDGKGQTSSSGLRITPRKNYTINPGESVKDKLLIGNLNGKVPLYVTLKVVDFTFMDDTGTPKLMLGENTPPTTWSLKPFVTLPDKVKVDPGKTMSVDIALSVPKSQGAGSYYSAIQYLATPSEGGNVNLSASGVTLAFVSIPGVVKEDMKLVKFGAFQQDPGGNTGKFIKVATANSPAVISFSLKNDGNVSESPAGSIVIKDMFNNKVTTIEKANGNNNLALIGQTRRFDACINPKEKKVDLGGVAGTTVSCEKTSLRPGFYTASLDLYYGQNGNTTRTISGTTSFWYLPIWFIIACIVFLGLVAYAIWRIRRKLQGISSDRKAKQARFGRRG